MLKLKDNNFINSKSQGLLSFQETFSYYGINASGFSNSEPCSKHLFVLNVKSNKQKQGTRVCDGDDKFVILKSQTGKKSSIMYCNVLKVTRNMLLSFSRLLLPCLVYILFSFF